MIHLQHAAFVYQAPDGEVEALRDVSFDVVEGEFCSIVGPSGCGKSTLLSALAGLEPLSGGARYGLAEFAAKRPAQLSGGMRQRCALIRTLAPDPKVLLLDEPFSALDYQTRLAVSSDIYRIIRREGKTALLVTHDISEAVSMSDRVFVLSRRPAVVKKTFDLSALRRLDPLQRRDDPAFGAVFNAIWKELELHE